jgi:hypothetical protein
MRRAEAAILGLLVLFAAGVLISTPPAAAGPRVARRDPGPKACLENLQAMDVAAQSRCLRRVLESGTPGAADLTRLVDFLAGSDGTTDHLLIASVLDVLRAMGSNGAPATETLSGLLPHRSRLYKERDKVLVVRLRAYIMVTLSEIGLPSSALPALLDTLALMDVRMTAFEVGAAARAVGSLGPRGRDLATYLLDTLIERFSAEEFSLERYDPQFPPHEATTVHLEAVRALGLVCSADDQEVLTVLRRLAEGPGRDELDPRVKQEAQRALKLIVGREHPPSSRGEGE